MYYCCGITDSGSVYSHNEDSFLINKLVMNKAQLETNLHTPFMCGVADGVGGEAAGEVASRLVLELASGIKIAPSTNYAAKVKDIHRYLRRYGIANGNINMQTTLCALTVDAKNNATIINVGDSKLYRYRNGKLRQLSTDQSLVQLLYEQGKITREEKRLNKNKNIIFPVMGNVDDDPKIEVTPIENGIMFGDLILICSDGLADYITVGEFEDTLALPQKLPKRLARLVELAKNGGSEDNITVVGLSRRE